MRTVCSRSPISSYDFMRYLCATLTKRNRVIIELKDLVNRIYDFKTKNGHLRYMFEDIEFRKGINNVVSNDISEAIINLHIFGVATRLNLEGEKLMICLTEKEADVILEECDEAARSAMRELAKTF